MSAPHLNVNEGECPPPPPPLKCPTSGTTHPHSDKLSSEPTHPPPPPGTTTTTTDWPMHHSHQMWPNGMVCTAEHRTFCNWSWSCGKKFANYWNTKILTTKPGFRQRWQIVKAGGLIFPGNVIVCLIRRHGPLPKPCLIDSTGSRSSNEWLSIEKDRRVPD